MATSMNRKGRITIPKHICDALELRPGSLVDFAVNARGEVVLRKGQEPTALRERAPDRFDAVSGCADVAWRTDELMKLLRADD